MYYVAEIVTLSLACWSPGSDVTAAWKSAECCWANSFISMATFFCVSVEETKRGIKKTVDLTDSDIVMVMRMLRGLV